MKADSADTSFTRNRPAAAEELALLKRYREHGDTAAREELVQRLQPWVRRVAARYNQKGIENEDLVQVGLVGLVKAIDRFDFSRGVRLTTFAEPNVSGEIKRYFRDHGWFIKPPRELQELNSASMSAIDALAMDLQRSPTVSEVAEYLDISVDQVLEAIHAGTFYESAPLERPSTDGESTNGSDHALAVDDRSLDLVEDRQALAPGLQTLSQRDRQIVRLRFFDELTQSEIAERVGISQMQVSRILRSAIAEIRNNLESSGLTSEVQGGS